MEISTKKTLPLAFTILAGCVAALTLISANIWIAAFVEELIESEFDFEYVLNDSFNRWIYNYLSSSLANAGIVAIIIIMVVLEVKKMKKNEEEKKFNFYGLMLFIFCCATFLSNAFYIMTYVEYLADILEYENVIYVLQELLPIVILLASGAAIVLKSVSFLLSRKKPAYAYIPQAPVAQAAPTQQPVEEIAVASTEEAPTEKTEE